MSLISTFKRANSLTIKRTLDKLTTVSNFYSECIELPDLTMYNECCAYVHGDEIVFLLNDNYHANEEVQADEKPFMGGSPMYFTEVNSWTSPVYLIQLLCHAFKEVMRKTGREVGKVHGVLLTSTKIRNKEDMEDLWEWLGVTVIDEVSCLVMTNDNGQKREKGLLKFFLDNISQATWNLDPEFDCVVENYIPLEERMQMRMEEEMREDIECERIPWDEDDD